MNMYDYLKWRGDLTFRQDGFNIVDNLLFAYACYTDLTEVVTEDEIVTIHEAAERLFKLHTEEEMLNSGSLIAHAPVILRRMGESKRFGNLLISNYVRRVNEQDTEQFSAMHFQIDPRTTYIAFCGTDDTIIGWKEDFQMSYKVIKAEISSAEYINRTAKKSFHRYYVGGHSKGGTLAVYAAMKASPSIKKKIISVYSNDGPGISPIAMDAARFAAIQPKLIKVIPELSIVGSLFDNDDNKVIIQSSESLFWEHDAVGWQILGKDFERGTLTEESKLIREGVRDFLASMDMKQREEWVNEMFLAFDKAGIVGVPDFSKKGLPILAKFIKEILSINDNAKDAFGKLGQVFGSLASERAEDVIKTRFKSISDGIGDMIKSIGKKKDDMDSEKE